MKGKGQVYLRVTVCGLLLFGTGGWVATHLCMARRLPVTGYRPQMRLIARRVSRWRVARSMCISILDFCV